MPVGAIRTLEGNRATNRQGQGLDSGTATVSEGAQWIVPQPVLVPHLA